jgi:hypothetical protein
MRQSKRYAAVIAVLLAAGGVALWAGSGSRVSAQTPPAPCACSRPTPIFSVDEVNPTPGQLQPRYGVTHCQCGAATCVSQVADGALGIPQLFCGK